MNSDARQILESPELFLQSEIESQGITFDAIGVPVDIKPGVFLAKVKLNYASQVNDMKKSGTQITRIQKEYFDLAYTVYAARIREENFASIIAKTNCDHGENLAPLQQFVVALRRHECPLTVAVLAHCIANCKRKMRRLKSYNEMMPIFYGPQKGGKSEAMRKLLSPLAELLLFKQQLTAVSNAKDQLAMAESPAVFFDECGKAQQAAMEELKNFISTPYIDVPIVYQSGNSKIRNCSSLWGCSNKPVATQFNDPTGMRRFWQIITQKKLDWAAVNNLDAFAIWAGIDESKDYIAPYMDEIDRVQSQELTTKDGLGCFLEAYRIHPVEEDSENAFIIQSSHLYQVYNIWCREGAVFPVPITRFPAELSAYGISKSRKSAGSFFCIGNTHALPAHTKSSVAPLALTSIKKAGQYE